MSNLSSYLGQVATRTYTPNYNSGYQQGMFRSIHSARQALTEMRIGEVNWFVSGGTENPGAAPVTVHAAIEYPLGTPAVPFTWSGNWNGTIAPGALLLSDPLFVNIPEGAQFAVRRYLTSSTSIPFVYQSNISNATLGDATYYGNSGIPDVTLGAGLSAFPSNYAPNSISTPALILARTTRRSVLLVGDSRQTGFEDTADALTGDIGEMGRALGPYLAYTNAGQPGETLLIYLSQHKYRNSLLPYFSDVVVNYGINDSTGGQTLAQFEANVQIAVQFFVGKRLYWTTLPPFTNSGNTAVGSTVRVGYNEFLMNTGIDAITPIDIRRVLENGFTGLWANAAWTFEGVHETAAGNIALRDSGVVQQTVLP